MLKTVATLIVLVLATGCASRRSPAHVVAPDGGAGGNVPRLLYEGQPDRQGRGRRAILEGESLLFINDMPTDGVNPGDVVSFVDATQNTIANGKVVEIVGNKVAASYTAATRAPVTGDVAVKF
jgi:hypothetical protein